MLGVLLKKKISIKGFVKGNNLENMLEMILNLLPKNMVFLPLMMV